jgi:hypothetical protein
MKLTQDRVTRVSIGNVWIAEGYLVSSNRNVARKIGIVDVEKSVIGVVRVKGQAQQTLLAATSHQLMHIQEGRGKNRTVY